MVVGRANQPSLTASASSWVRKQRSGALRPTPRGSKPMRSNFSRTSWLKKLAPNAP
ncbi:hypothetical protein ACVDFE_18345 [Lentzea chajnantorensis]